MRRIKTGFMILVFAAGFIAASLPRYAAAACCSCISSVTQTENQEWPDTEQTIDDHVDDEFDKLETWIGDTLWGDNILPALKLMAEQLTAVAMQQVLVVGAFMDAKHQMETQQVLQTMNARAHKDYHPSIGMCEFGSSAKSLAASERKAEYNAVLMSQRSQDRSLGSAYSAASKGEDSDKVSRLKQFREKFCDPADNNNGLDYICDHDQDGNPATGRIGATRFTPAPPKPAPDRMNKDIDFARTIEDPWTLKIDFSDPDLTENEEEVLALASNLYGHYVFRRPPGSTLKNVANSGGVTQMQKLYMDLRAVIAKQSVAENSFNAITAMKSEGTPGSKDFMQAILAEVGVSNTAPAAPVGALSDVDLLLGENPSYYAQMEVLTKKIYQNPEFYTNLYDKPANVTRKGVALQAIGLMQKFDLFKSYLRTEASLSVLLELAVNDLQGEIEDEMGTMTSGGQPPQ